MPLNILDFDDVMLEAQAKLSEMLEEFDKEFYAPLAEAQVGEAWNKMPGETKLLLRKVNKAAVDQLDRDFGGV